LKYQLDKILNLYIPAESKVFLLDEPGCKVKCEIKLNREFYSLFRISITEQSLMSQLYPVNFNPLTQSTYIEPTESIDNASIMKNSTIAFRPIIPKGLTRNTLSATNDNVQQLSHSNTNNLLTNSDPQDYSTVNNHLTSTYRSLS
jgi:hypothetical protein